ncbi:MAG: hypothetical protein CM1200mP24_00790 [Gammaproteobacteria bacterium]|nr:MAG: hypothetical protein CM1200mP24_00790 [Gammaproteobacteria bacterium]
MQGRTLQGIVENDTPNRDTAIYGMFGGHVNITDGRYVYMRAPGPDNQPLKHYTLMPTHMRSPFTTVNWQKWKNMTRSLSLKNFPVMRIPATGMAQLTSEFKTQLFDLKKDPSQIQPILDNTIEKQMISKLRQALEWNHAPTEQYLRLGLDY